MTLPPQKSDSPAAEPPGRDARIEKLAQQAAALNHGVTELMEGTGTAIVGLAKRGRSTRRLVTALAVSLVLDLLLTFGLTFTIGRTQTNGHRVDRLSTNLRTQLCGVLQILVNADTPQNTTAARLRGDDLATRTASFRIIHRSYSSLNCSKVIR